MLQMPNFVAMSQILAEISRRTVFNLTSTSFNYSDWILPPLCKWLTPELKTRKRNKKIDKTVYSATTRTGPLRTKLTNQSVNWEQRMTTLFVNEPMKLKNANNGLTTKIWNPTKLRRVADVSGNFVTFWLVRFHPIFWNFFPIDFSTFQTRQIISSWRFFPQ